jgi:hypothetical protein
MGTGGRVVPLIPIVAAGQRPFVPSRPSRRCAQPRMDPLHLALALGPLGVYLLVLGQINLRRRPVVVSGAFDFALLAFGVVGLVIVGPIELFLPETAAAAFGSYVWLVLLAMYGLGVTMLVLLGRPRLVVYNATVDELRPVLADVALELDAEARWAGDTLVLPQLGVQLHLEPFAAMRNVSAVAAGPRQNLAGWHRLQSALADAVRQLGVRRNPRGYSLVFFGVLMLALSGWRVGTTWQQVVHDVRQMLRIDAGQ